MQVHGYFNHAFRILTALLLLAVACQGQVTTSLSTSFIARGENAWMEIAVSGGNPESIPKIVPIKGVEIRDMGRGWMPRGMSRGVGIEMVYQYVITGYDVGRYSIPPINVTVDGTTTASEPLDFVIFDPDDLKWSEVESSGKLIRYAGLFLTLNDKPYENETTPVEIKVFFPAAVPVEDWGIPDFERDGVAAWRFQPLPRQNQLILLGQAYVSVAYPSTITPTRTGKISIGPAKVRLIIPTMVLDPTPRRLDSEIYADIPKLEMDAIPLPQNAPDGFGNAVGSFHLSASTAVSEIREGDPLTVDLIVTGRGNLDTLQPPKLSETNGWKVYTTTTEQRGDERRQAAGNVTFHQSIRPLEMKDEIPAFKLVYFDLKDDSYKTLLSDPIPLKMIQNIAPKNGTNAATQALPVPLERMADILEVLRPANLVIPPRVIPPAWFGHVVAGVLALILAAKAWWMRYSHVFSKNPGREARLRELQQISAVKSGEDLTFLKAAGGFIERRLGGKMDDDLQGILAERDRHCFRDDRQPAELGHQRRGEILRLLRKAALAITAFIVIGSAPAARANDNATRALEAYDGAKYEDAAKLWLGAAPYGRLSADAFYNVGNACFRAGSPGQAALYYRRALNRDASHGEALQNLRFIERKFGAITVTRPEYQYALAKLPLAGWQAAFWTGLWMCALALLVFPATRPGAKLRLVAIAALVLGPILVSGGLLGWHYFPNDARFAPVERQAVIIAEKVVLHADAARTSPEVIDAPAGSLCEVLRESGGWAYVAFATKTRGWVESELIEKVEPPQPPQPPKFRKPKSDGKSA